MTDTLERREAISEAAQFLLWQYDRKGPVLDSAEAWEQLRLALSLPAREVDALPNLEPVMLSGLTWQQAHSGLDAVDCAIRRAHWCSPVVVLQDGKPVIDDDGEIKPFGFMPGDRSASDWMMVPRVGDDGTEIAPRYRAALATTPAPREMEADLAEAVKGFKRIDEHVSHALMGDWSIALKSIRELARATLAKLDRSA